MDWYYISKITNIIYIYFTLFFCVASVVTILVTIFKRSSKVSKKRKIIRTISLVFVNIFLLAFIHPFHSFAKGSEEATENFNQIDYNSLFSYAKDNSEDFDLYSNGNGGSCYFIIDGVDVVLHFDRNSEFSAAKADKSYMCYNHWDELFSIRQFSDDRGIIYLPAERDIDIEEIPMNKSIINDIYIFTNYGDVEVSYHTTTNNRDTLRNVSEALKQMSDGSYIYSKK